MEQSLLPLFSEPRIPGKIQRVQPYPADVPPPINPGAEALGPEYTGRFKDIYLQTKTLPAGQPIYRSGQEREVRPSGVLWKITEKEDEQPRFFSTAHVAAMYGDERNVLFKYIPKTDIQLLVIDKGFCDFLHGLIGLASVIKLPPGRAALFQKFLLTFGYYTDAAEAQTILAPYPELRLAPKYPKVGDFNRISTSANDFEVFSRVMDALRALDRRFNVYQGFYMHPMNSGMWNTHDLLSLQGIFPEEIYFHPSDVDIPGFPGGGLGNPNTALAVVPFHSETPGYRWVPSDNIRQHREYTCFHVKSLDDMPTDDKSLLNDSKPHVLKYICYVNGQYRDIRKLFDAQDKTYKIPPGDIARFYRIFIDYIQMLYNHIERDVFQEIAKVIHEFYRIDGRLYNNMPQAGATPFNDADGNFNENLFIFTILNNTLKANVGGLNNSLVLASQKCSEKIAEYLDKHKDIPFEYDKPPTTFNAVISGGALFGLYTHGEERKQTKDIDMKIVYTGDKDNPDNGNELLILINPGKFCKLECYHMLATYITYIWTSFTQHLFDNLTGYKIFVFKDTLDRPDVYGLSTDRYTLPKSVEKEYRAEARSSSTYRKFNIEVELDRAFKKLYPDKSILNEFHSFLTKNPVSLQLENPSESKTLNSYQEFMNIRLDILSKKREVPKEDVVRRQIMNENLRRLVEVFRMWYKTLVEPAIPDDQKQLYTFYSSDLPTFLSGRPYLQFKNGAEYRIGYFSSLFINEYGLIDYTYDSRFTTIGSFTKFSGLLDNGYNDENGTPSQTNILYGSGFHFIYESYKLNEICGKSYHFDDEFNAKGMMNPFNECAPSPENREAKRQKYKNRAERVLRYITATFPKEMAAMGDTLEGMINFILADPNRLKTIQWLTTELIKRSTAGRAAEYFIGGGRKRRGTYKRSIRKRKQTRRRRTSRKSKY